MFKKIYDVLLLLIIILTSLSWYSVAEFTAAVKPTFEAIINMTDLTKPWIKETNGLTDWWIFLQFTKSARKIKLENFVFMKSKVTPTVYSRLSSVWLLQESFIPEWFNCFNFFAWTCGWGRNNSGNYHIQHPYFDLQNMCKRKRANRKLIKRHHQTRDYLFPGVIKDSTYLLRTNFFNLPYLFELTPLQGKERDTNSRFISPNM